MNTNRIDDDGEEKFVDDGYNSNDQNNNDNRLPLTLCFLSPFPLLTDDN
jgi:hypothetical protein